MDADKILEKLQGYLSLEQKFLHQRFKAEAEKLNKEQLVEIVDIVHV